MSGKHSSRNARRATLCLLACYLSAPVALSDRLEFSDDETVTVTAEKAWEAEEPGVVHFSGQFELRAPDWALFGDTAVIYGKLDDPDRVVVEGKPARISFMREAEENETTTDPEERVDGSAAVVEYFRATDKLRMRGEASLTRKDSTLVSDKIEYDVDTDRYSGSGEGGIRIRLSTDDY